MTTITERLRVVREAFNRASKHGVIYADDLYSLAALEAEINAMQDMCIPELPKGWRIGTLGLDVVHHEQYWFCRLDRENGERRYAEGPTPRAAVLAAIAKIEQGD